MRRSADGGLLLFRRLREAQRWKAEFCCAFDSELSVGRRLLLEFRSEFWIALFGGQAIKSERVRHILFEQFH